ncbi:MAG: hypothetical protein FLDDKLPJ_03743 [Phycisphaerae bacterium]|nr:hypothetical protein [Phycisphaerae bacterium]
MMQPLDLLQWAQNPLLRLADRPWLLRTAGQLQKFPEDPYLEEPLRMGVEQQTWKAASSQDAFYANYPPLQVELPGDLALAQLPGGRVLGMSVAALLRNAAVVGPTGSGKTSMLLLLLSQLALKARILVIDRKRELRRLAGVPQFGQLWTVLSWRELALALLQPPPGVPVEVWAAELVSLIARSYSLYASQRPMLELLLETYKAQGGQACLEHWEQRVRSWMPGKGYREAGYKEAMLWVLVQMRLSASAFRFARSNLLELLFSPEEGGVVIELDSLPVEHYAFFVSYLLRWLYTWRLHSRVCTPSVVFCLDDATIALEEARDREAPGGVAPLAESLFMGRGLGMGVVAVSHAYSTTSSRIRHNTESLIVCGAQGDDLRSLATAMGLTPEQAGALRVLQRGEVVVCVPSTWPAAVKGVYPLISAHVNDFELRAGAEVFLSKVIAAEAAKATPDKQARETLTPDRLRLLSAAAFHPLLNLTALYREASLDRASGKSVLSALHALGFVVPHRVSSGKRGGHGVFVEVTEQGWQELIERGFSRPDKPTKGGFLHNLAALALEFDGRRQGCKVHFEAQVNAVFVDVLWQSPEGRLQAHQIGLSNPRYEADKLLQLLQASGVASVVLIAKDKVFQEKVSTLLRGKLSEDEPRLTLRCLGDVLNSERS